MEGIGALHLTGSRRHEVLRMAAITLALSPLGGQIELAVAGGDTAPGLQALDAQRVQPHADLAAAVAALTTHHTGQLATLTAGGTDSLSRARLDADIEELPPLVLIADLDACPDPDRVKDGWALLDQSPSSALATLTGGADVAILGRPGRRPPPPAAARRPGTSGCCDPRPPPEGDRHPMSSAASTPSGSGCDPRPPQRATATARTRGSTGST